jgi:Bardet-Biedl syndrome 1 protein|tara:strand:+ start:1143 stop:1856 length:714 start_codon:yes stop_codon:yes gene_type:complete
LREAEVWRSLSVNALTSEQAFHTLTDLKDTAGALLSERACSFTEIDDAKLRERFVRAHATSEPPTRVTSVTALGSIKQTSDDADAVSVLFFATETGELHVLSPDAKQIGKTYRLPSPAAFVTATGRTNSEYKILCACRDGRVYLIENGFLLTETVFELETQVCGLCVVGNDVVVGCADHTAHAFAIAGTCWGFPKSKHCFISQLVTVVHTSRYTILTLSFYSTQITIPAKGLEKRFW